MNIITTFPLSFRVGRSYKLLYTPFVADVFSRLFGAKILLPINQIRLRTETSKTLWQHYQKQLFQINIRVSEVEIWSDLTPNFHEFVQCSVQELMFRGLCYPSSRTLLCCECGTVEIPIASKFVNYYKLIGKNNDSCVKCSSKLTEKTGEVLVIKNTLAKPFAFFQPSMQARFEAVCGQNCHGEIIISRLRRSMDSHITYQGFTLDPDLCLGLYPAYMKFCFPNDNIVFVVGMSTLSQVSKAARFSSILDRGTVYPCVVHPTITFPESLINARDVSDLVSVMGETCHIRMLWSLGLNWQRYDSMLTDSDVVISRKTSLDTTNDPMWKAPDLETTMRCLSRHNILRLLKKIRTGAELSVEEYSVGHAIVA